jgi:hypothetical protein
MFCEPGLVFGGTVGAGSRFHIFCSRSRFPRYQGCRFLFLCFELPDMFLVVPSAAGPVFMFCSSRLVFGGTVGVGSRFHVLRSRTRFRRYGGRQVPFSCFARPDSFSAETMVSGLVFMFCAPGIVFGGTEGVRSRFHVLHTRLIFGGTEGVRSRFHVLRSRTRFRRYRGRPILF